MKQIKFLLIVLCFAAITSAIGCASRINNQENKMEVLVSGDYPEYLSIDEIAQNSDLIIEGTVIDERVEEIDNLIHPNDTDDPKINPGGEVLPSKNVYTVHIIQVNNSFKGIYDGDTIEVRQIGGEKEIWIEEDVVKLEKGETYVLFIDKYMAFPAYLKNPIQSSYKYSKRAKELKDKNEKNWKKEKFENVNKKNKLTLTYESLEKIKYSK